LSRCQLGHAQQHQQGSAAPIQSHVSGALLCDQPTVSYLLIAAGLLLHHGPTLAGNSILGVVVFFMLLCASDDPQHEGLRLLRETGLMVTAEDTGGSRQVLTAAALTYVAAFVTALLQLLYYISLAQRRD
jgi:Zn-dependent membrane protease YugP